MKCACTPRMTSKVTVQRPSTTKDAAGHVDLSQDANWLDAGTRPCRILTRGGREGRVFDQVQAETSMIVEMHADSLTKTIIPKWRLRLGTRKFNITAAYDVDEMHRTIRIEASEAK